MGGGRSAANTADVPMMLKATELTKRFISPPEYDEKLAAPPADLIQKRCKHF
jgi:hypothetical protein